MYLPATVDAFEELETSPLVRRLHSMSSENVFFLFFGKNFFSIFFIKKTVKKRPNMVILTVFDIQSEPPSPDHTSRGRDLFFTHNSSSRCVEKNTFLVFAEKNFFQIFFGNTVKNVDFSCFTT